MINRELIRLKTVQIAYAYYQNEGKDVAVAEKELFFSLSKAYDLYQQLMLLTVSINNIAIRAVETKQARARRLGETDNVSTKFIDNRFMKQLEQNEQLIDFRDHQKRTWADEEEFVRRLYNQIVESDIYNEYMQSQEDSYEADREVWRKIYRNIICNSEELDEVLENMSLYWNDDKQIVDTFVLKTIKKFEEANGAQQPLLPEFRNDEDKAYTSRLIRNALTNEEQYRQLISDQTHNWKLDRMATMDVIIMQIALAEIITCPEIPISVSINEYVEIAKAYSTPRSGGYINGVLDNISKRLLAENKLIGKK